MVLAIEDYYVLYNPETAEYLTASMNDSRDGFDYFTQTDWKEAKRYTSRNQAITVRERKKVEDPNLWDGLIAHRIVTGMLRVEQPERK